MQNLSGLFSSSKVAKKTETVTDAKALIEDARLKIEEFESAQKDTKESYTEYDEARQEEELARQDAEKALQAAELIVHKPSSQPDEVVALPTAQLNEDSFESMRHRLLLLQQNSRSSSAVAESKESDEAARPEVSNLPTYIRRRDGRSLRGDDEIISNPQEVLAAFQKSTTPEISLQGEKDKSPAPSRVVSYEDDSEIHPALISGMAIIISVGVPVGLVCGAVLLAFPPLAMAFICILAVGAFFVLMNIFHELGCDFSFSREQTFSM